MTSEKQTQKVLHIMSSFGGGISSFIKNKAEVLKNEDIVFDIITFDDVTAQFNNLISETGGRVYKISNPKKIGFRQFYNQVNSIMEKQPKNTLVHSHVYGVKAIPFYLIARKNGLKRFVIHAHTAAPALKNSNIQEKFKKIINNLISKEKLSCGIKASINIFGKKTAYSDTIVHIPNSINYHSFNTDLDIKKLKKEILDVDDDRLIIGSIARFRELKNHDFMIEVIDKLKQEQIEFIWFFAGDGLLKKDIEKKVKERRLEKYVYFLGRRDDIPELFSIMDIFTLPSLNEGLPTVVIEAQATSTTSLISDTITKECDMNLGLVEFLSIQNIEPWLDAIKMFVPKNIAKSKIEQCLIESSFTNETSAELYKNFLRKEIKYYNI
ncbi:glycosyltransferase [Marinilactibacillus psychrotolerans]|uniref:glycosyltransferase n=1 Tax=Marinilactibacillus psychrotolerans TaxID=191770 RepID=UPI001868A7A0|nr:glycosyltransferase [Marinilactibacillus psychrotolerans]